MTCKRQGEARSDLHTMVGATRLENIRLVEIQNSAEKTCIRVASLALLHACTLAE